MESEFCNRKYKYVLYYITVINEVPLTKTVVTVAFTSPLYAIANSANLLAMVSMFLSLPFSATTTSQQTNES